MAGPEKRYARGPELEREVNEQLQKKVAPYERLRGGIGLVDIIAKSTAGKALRQVLAGQARKE